jgi:hypothetical protein
MITRQRLVITIERKEQWRKRLFKIKDKQYFSSIICISSSNLHFLKRNGRSFA